MSVPTPRGLEPLRVPKTLARLAVIGGGSAYAPGLLLALLHHRERLSLSEVVLYDIDPEHLEVVHALGDALCRSAAANFRVRAAASLAEAVAGADVVLNSARPGGLRCRRIDEELPLELGIPGQETVGPGGFFFALRSVPAARQLAAMMRQKAPEALLLNYTNPTNIVTQALVDEGFHQVIGLCDQAEEDLALLGQVMFGPGGDPSPLHFSCTGLNHATWYRGVRYGPRPFDPRAYQPVEPAAHEVLRGLDPEKQLRFEVCQTLWRTHPNAWPNSYLAYYRAPDRFAKLLSSSIPRAQRIQDALPSYYEHFREQAKQPSPHVRMHRGTEGFGDLVVRTLMALGKSDRDDLVCNLPNDGMSEDFADDTVVEAVVGVDHVGVHRRPCPPLPEGEQARMAQLETYQRATATAARLGDRALALDALSANPLVPHREAASWLLAEAERRYGAEIPLFQT